MRWIDGPSTREPSDSNRLTTPVGRRPAGLRAIQGMLGFLVLLCLILSAYVWWQLLRELP